MHASAGVASARGLLGFPRSHSILEAVVRRLVDAKVFDALFEKRLGGFVQAPVECVRILDCNLGLADVSRVHIFPCCGIGMIGPGGQVGYFADS